jgi:hypothetical protein
MTEQEIYKGSAFGESEGLPAGEPDLADVTDISDYLSATELKEVRSVAEELQIAIERGSESIPAMPDEPEPPIPSKNV